MIDKKYVTMDRSPFFELARPYLNPSSKVLDIGAGAGSFPKHFNRNDFFLVDGNKSTVERLSENYRNTFYTQLPLLPFDDKSFDLIHCSHVIEHLDVQTFYDTLKEIDRCIKPGGVLIISAPLMWQHFYDDLSHLKPYTPEVIKKYLIEDKVESMTRNKISSSYIEIETVYRFREIQELQDYYNITRNIFIIMYFKYRNLLYRLGLRKYIKNGFTIVLKKHAS